MISAVIGAARPRFLSLTLLSVLIGIGATIQQHRPVSADMALLTLLGALLAHGCVNLLNEYHDFRSGLDAITVRTPFSGGSGSLPAHPQAAAATLGAGLACLAAVTVIGLFFVQQRGAALLPIGLAGVVLIAAYTPVVTRMPLFCLLAPGLGFGPLMVIGSVLALGGSYSWGAAAASLPPLLFASELLLLNQFPDLEADRQVGRRHLPIVLGRRRCAVVFAGMVMAAFAAIAIAVAAGLLPRACLLCLLLLPAGLWLARRVYRHAEDLGKLVPDLGLNVALIHLTLGVFAAALMLG